MTNSNMWKAFLLGSLGGAVGAVAMNYYWQAIADLTGQDPRQAERDQPIPPDLQEFTDISLIGRQHQEGESSTAAMGRMIYTTLMGQEPESEETKTLLSYLVHYSISMGTAGLYSALRGKADMPDLVGGFLMGTALWLFGDELLMPLAGLTRGPVAYPSELHLHSWGAHIAYGVGSALTTQFLEAAFDLDGD